MPRRTHLLTLAFLLLSTALSASGPLSVPPKYAVLTFYDWKHTDQASIDRFHLTRDFVNLYSMRNIANALNRGAAYGWAPVQTVFVPGTSGTADITREADKIVIIVKNPHPTQ